MAVDPISSSSAGGVTSQSVEGTSNSGTGATKKVAPNSVADAALNVFIPGMISSQLMLNNSLFNFAKEAIDEADQ